MKKKKLNNTTKKFIIPSITVIILVLLLGGFYAFCQTTKSQLLYEKYQLNDLKLYLSKFAGFDLTDDSTNDFAMIGNDMMVTVLIDEKTIFSDNNVDIPNLFVYAATIASNNDALISSIEEYNGYYTFELTNEQNDNEFHYYAATFESEDDFYLVTFTCLQKDADKLDNSIYHYFEMIEISN